jgi:hypothetical protein
MPLEILSVKDRIKMTLEMKAVKANGRKSISALLKGMSRNPPRTGPRKPKRTNWANFKKSWVQQAIRVRLSRLKGYPIA